MSEQVIGENASMQPDTDEATRQQVDLARAQGDAFGRALAHMTGVVAHDGGEQPAGHYLIGYAVEEAEGMCEWTGGGLVWLETDESAP